MIGIDTDELVIVIGRGNSGTRVLSHMFMASGVFMGSLVNESGDKMPFRKMYEACLLFSKHVKQKSDFEWNFAELSKCPIPDDFKNMVGEYLGDILTPSASTMASFLLRGWKLPETTLVYPWIVRMFPKAKYIYLVRDPRSSIATAHNTDDLAKWGVPVPETESREVKRAQSWLYQYQIVEQTPRPKNFLKVRFEDLVLHHEREVRKLEEFLNIPLARIPMRTDVLRRARKVDDPQMAFLKPYWEVWRDINF